MSSTGPGASAKPCESAPECRLTFEDSGEPSPAQRRIMHYASVQSACGSPKTLRPEDLDVLGHKQPSHVEPFRRTPALKQKVFCSLGRRSRVSRMMRTMVVNVSTLAGPLPRRHAECGVAGDVLPTELIP